MVFLLHVSGSPLPTLRKLYLIILSYDLFGTNEYITLQSLMKRKINRIQEELLLTPVHLHFIPSCQSIVLFQWYHSQSLLNLLHFTEYYIQKISEEKEVHPFQKQEKLRLCCVANIKIFYCFFKVSTQESVLKTFVEPCILHPPEIPSVLLSSIYLFDGCYFHQCKVFLQHYFLQMSFRKKYVTVIKNLLSFSTEVV